MSNVSSNASELASVVNPDSAPTTSELEREIASSLQSEEAITSVHRRPKVVTAVPPAVSPAAHALARAIDEARSLRDYDKDLEWLLQSGDSAMGERGTTGAVVGQIERGSVGGSGNLDARGCYKHPYTDQQIGDGPMGIGEVELHRHLVAAWVLVKADTRRRLILRYSAPHAEYRADQGYGAKDKHVEGSDARTGQHAPTRTGLDPTDESWRYAALALSLADRPGALLEAYRDPDPNHMKKGVVVINRKLQAQRAKLRAAAMKAARKVAAEDHVEWFAARSKVAGVRTTEVRIGRKRSQVLTSGVATATPARHYRLARSEAESWEKVGQTLLAGAAAQAAE